MIDTTLLHARVAASAEPFLRELFGEGTKRAGTGRWRVGRRGSLAICIKYDALVFFSHEDGRGGDAVALWQRERGGAMGEALKAVAAWAQVPDEESTSSRPARRKPGDDARATRPEHNTSGAKVKEDSDSDALHMPWPKFEEARLMSERLTRDCALSERIADRGGWRVETIISLSREGVLGWSDGWVGYHTGALSFHYESGLKQRWRRGGERMIRWSCGGPRLF